MNDWRTTYLLPCSLTIQVEQNSTLATRAVGYALHYVPDPGLWNSRCPVAITE